MERRDFLRAAGTAPLAAILANPAMAAAATQAKAPGKGRKPGRGKAAGTQLSPLRQ